MMRCVWVAVLLLACDDATTEDESALSGDCRRDGCNEGETCNDWSDRGTWVCEVLAEFGQDCTAHDQCASGSCANDGSGAPPYCTEKCGEDAECDEGYYCDLSLGLASAFCRREG